MIHFNELPNSNPMSLIPVGRYTATVSKAEMRQGKDPSKPPYLNITWDLKDENGSNRGKLFDIITEPTSPFTQYKLKRFILGLNLPINGDFELKDLVKIVTGKTCQIDVTIDEKSEPNRNQVDAFKGEIYYPLTAASTTAAPTQTSEPASPIADDDLPWEDAAPTIDASDAADAGEAEAPAPESSY